MKLTKGRITKMLNKKRQSLKRYKKAKRSHKTKTFRKRKHFNLHNRSLKKYRGGQPEGPSAITTSDQPVDEPSTEPITAADPEVITKQAEEREGEGEGEGEGERAEEKVDVATDNELSSQSPNELHIDVPEVQDATFEHEEPITKNEEALVAPEEDTITLPIAREPVLSTENSNVDADAGKGPGDDAPLPLSIDEQEKEQEQEQTGREMEKTTDDERLDDATEEHTEDVTAGVIDSGATTSTPSLANETGDTGLTIVAESLENLANYISEKIAQKVTNKMREGSTYGKSNEDLDSFNKVAMVSQEMADHNSE